MLPWCLVVKNLVCSTSSTLETLVFFQLALYLGLLILVRCEVASFPTGLLICQVLHDINCHSLSAVQISCSMVGMTVCMAFVRIRPSLKL